jgi:uncharacterized membrane protein YeaQ/YmgE (transglycosylase-associated protein family)
MMHSEVKRKHRGERANGRRATEEEEKRSIMNLEMFVTWVLVGLLTGWLAGFVMHDGGYGLIWDLILGLVGSSAASGIFWALGVTTETGQFVTAVAVVAFVGAAIVIVAQRKVYAHA